MKEGSSPHTSHHMDSFRFYLQRDLYKDVEKLGDRAGYAGGVEATAMGFTSRYSGL